MRFVLKSALLAALAIGLWYAASPWYAMWQVVSAAEEGDAERLEELVDFEALRAGMRADLAASRDDGDSDILDRIGDGIVKTVGGAAIDTFANPNGLAVLLDASTLVPGEDYSWDVERDGLDRFRAVSTTGDGDPGPSLVFKREGLGWQMIGVAL